MTQPNEGKAIPRASEVELSDKALKALSHPLRRRILSLLEAVPHARVTTLADRLDSPANSVSFHLRSLEQAGLVKRVAGDTGDRRESHWTLTGATPALASAKPETDAYLTSQELEQIARLREVFQQAHAYLSTPPGERVLKAELLTRTLLLDEDGFVELFRDMARVVDKYSERSRSSQPDDPSLKRWDVTVYGVRDWDGTGSS